MRLLKLSLLSLGLAVGATTSAAAQQVNFDDLAGNLNMIESPYAGFNWGNAFVMNPGAVYGVLSAGGFGSALSSGDRVLGNANAQDLSISSASAFNLLSGTFAAGWTNGLQLNVKGFSGATELYNQTYVLDWSMASNLELNLFGVDRVVFSSFGGTVDKMFGDGPNQGFAADDLEFGSNVKRIIGDDVVPQAVVPEPMTVTLMAAGLLVLGGAQARRRRASK